jgi:hypothetical protein
VSLAAALSETAEVIEEKLDRGTEIALINFESFSLPLSKFVLDELAEKLVFSGILTLLVRGEELNLAREELEFQMSGEVSDKSAQSIGQMLGAKSVVTGSLENMGDFYQYKIRVINVQSALVEAMYSVRLKRDKMISNLLRIGN